MPHERGYGGYHYNCHSHHHYYQPYASLLQRKAPQGEDLVPFIFATHLPCTVPVMWEVLNVCSLKNCRNELSLLLCDFAEPYAV
jgi:hypothetical protein